jgi:hypothetical protein
VRKLVESACLACDREIFGRLEAGFDDDTSTVRPAVDQIVTSIYRNGGCTPRRR